MNAGACKKVWILRKETHGRINRHNMTQKPEEQDTVIDCYLDHECCSGK